MLTNARFSLMILPTFNWFLSRFQQTKNDPKPLCLWVRAKYPANGNQMDNFIRKVSVYFLSFTTIYNQKLMRIVSFTSVLQMKKRDISDCKSSNKNRP